MLLLLLLLLLASASSSEQFLPCVSIYSYQAPAAIPTTYLPLALSSAHTYGCKP